MISDIPMVRKVRPTGARKLRARFAGDRREYALVLTGLIARSQHFAPRGRGRPRTGIGKPVGLRLYPELERRVDQWASRQPDKPGRPEAIRRLIEIALTAK